MFVFFYDWIMLNIELLICENVEKLLEVLIYN